MILNINQLSKWNVVLLDLISINTIFCTVEINIVTNVNAFLLSDL